MAEVSIPATRRNAVWVRALQTWLAGTGLAVSDGNWLSVFRVPAGFSLKPLGIELTGSRMPASCDPLSGTADRVAGGAVVVADDEDGAAEDELVIIEQPATRDVAAAARPSRRAERGVCTATALLS